MLTVDHLAWLWLYIEFYSILDWWRGDDLFDNPWLVFSLSATTFGILFLCVMFNMRLIKAGDLTHRCHCSSSSFLYMPVTYDYSTLGSCPLFSCPFFFSCFLPCELICPVWIFFFCTFWIMYLFICQSLCSWQCVLHAQVFSFLF